MKGGKTDITMYTENELSLLVFNCEDIYVMRHRPDFMEYINNTFIFTDFQLEILKDDLIKDLEEV